MKNQAVIFKVDSGTSSRIRTGVVLKKINGGGKDYFKVRADRLYPHEKPEDLIYFTEEVTPYRRGE